MKNERETAPNATGVVVGVDIGGSKTALLVTDVATGEDVAQDRFPTETAAGATANLEKLYEAVHGAIKGAGREPGDLRALGIAVPGCVDAQQGRVIRAGNLTGWRDLPLRDLASRALRVPVFVENDANAAALGEKWRGAAKQMHNFAFLALGTGVGVGLVINGRLHHGFHEAAGEAGNFIMGRRFLGKERGGHGNLELLVGGPAIRRQARTISGHDLSVAEVFQDASTSKPLARLAGRVADYLAITVINIAALLDPEAVILGGGTAMAGEPLLERIRARLDRELALVPALMASALGEDAQLHGAVFGALWQLDPSRALREELR